MRGRICSGMENAFSSSVSHWSVFRFISWVRLALVTSVRCRPFWVPAFAPPVSFHTRKGSMLPKRISPASARLRIDLAMLFLRAGHHLARAIEHNETRAGCPLVNGGNVVIHAAFLALHKLNCSAPVHFPGGYLPLPRFPISKGLIRLIPTHPHQPLLQTQAL